MGQAHPSQNLICYYVWNNHTKMEWISRKNVKCNCLDKIPLIVMLECMIYGLECYSIVEDSFLKVTQWIMATRCLAQRILGRESWLI